MTVMLLMIRSLSVNTPPLRYIMIIVMVWVVMVVMVGVVVAVVIGEVIYVMVEVV